MWWIFYGVTFIAAMALTAVFTPYFRRLANYLGFLDRPADNHKGHARATALLGGAAMFASWLFYMLCIMEFPLKDIFGGGADWHYTTKIIVIEAGAFLAVLLGLIDDKWALSAGTKFGGQFLIALLVVFAGEVKIKFFIDLPWLTDALSVFWLMLMMNAINFFDNMDGLAAGTIAIAMAFFTIFAGLNGEYFWAAFAALNCGVCCGFWFYNANPASIFMGDSGSHFLGFLAAVTAAEVTYFDIGHSLSRFPVLIPMFILALPLFDTAMVVLIRTWNRKPFWVGDHNHISHRFVRMGLSRRNAVTLVHLMALTVALGALPVYWGDFKTAAVIVGQAFLLLIIITVIQLHLGEKKENRN